jgi:hypothetical protein
MMNADDDVFADLHIPTTAELDAYTNRPLSHAPATVKIDAPSAHPTLTIEPAMSDDESTAVEESKTGGTGAEVNNSPGAGNTLELIPAVEVEEMTLTDLYDTLGWEWERCPLRWGTCEKTGRVGKIGIAHNLGKYNPGNGVILHLGGLMAIDIDDTSDRCAELRDLCEKAEAPHQLARKGFGHYLFKSDPRIKTRNAQKADTIKIDLKTGKNDLLLVEPSFYDVEGDRQAYRWVRKPLKDGSNIPNCPEVIIDWLTKYQQKGSPADAPAPKAKPVKNTLSHAPVPPAEEEMDSDDELALLATPPLPETPLHTELENLLGCLSVERLTESHEWRKMIYALKNVEDSETTLAMMLKHSRRSPPWNTDEAEASNKAIWLAIKPSGRSGIGSLKHWAKKDNPGKFFEDRKDDYWSLVSQNNANSFCRMFYNDMAGDILYSRAEKAYYVYDPKQTIWTKHEEKATLNFLFIERTHAILRKMDATLPPAEGEEDQAKLKDKRKILLKARAYCDRGGAITLVNSFLPAICSTETDPANYMNQEPLLLPLQNGVWDFEKKALVDYQREHYFTFKIPIKYEATADTADITKAFNDWFRVPAVAEFMKYWLGYCLTGETTRQEFLITWGTSAGNGKSLLWGTILNILTGDPDEPYKTYYRTINSDALSTERTGNNDQLYNMNGGRVAFLSEPRRTKGTKIDNEILKTLTGDKFFTAEAKYKNAITFKLTTKFVMGVNDLPEIKFEDKGTYRRVKIVEQNVAFLDAKDYEEADEKLKAEGRVQKKDDAFVSRLLANKSGLLLFALQGANAYIDNKRREAPPEMDSARDKAMGELDKLGNWLRSNVANLLTSKPAGYEKKKVSVKQIKEMMKAQGLNLGQNDTGFNRRFKDKATTMG